MKPTHLPASRFGNRILSLSVCLALLLAGSVNTPAQGKLDSFENDAVSTPPDQPPSHSDRRSHHDRDHHCEADHSWLGGFCDLFMDYVALGVLCGGKSSWDRVATNGDDDTDVAPRSLGEPLLPFARLDVAYQDVESDITAIDLLAEGGYGPFAIHLDLTHFGQEKPRDDLDIIRTLGMYRMSFGSHTEVDVGCGSMSLNGEESTTRFVFSLPILVHPSRHFGFEFRPAWANRITDYDLAVMLTWNYASLKFGYRWLGTPNESLNGPYIGISMRL